MMQEDAQLESRWLLHGDLSCLGCGYNLRGLVGPRVMCPECGQVNDLNDPKPWRVDALPLGVRDRQHWPASAAALSILFPVSLGAAMISSRDGSPVVSLALFAATLAIVFYWFRTCRLWIRSCISAGWGVFVLLVLHASVWLLLSGVWTTLYFLVERRTWYLVVVGPLGLAGFARTWRLLRDTPGGSQYREDWRTWQLPVGVVDRNRDANSTKPTGSSG